MIYRDKY